VFDVSRPVENRIVRFNQRPTDLQLGTDLGYGLMGGSDLDLKDELHVASVQPRQIPIRGVTVWMYFVLGLIATLLRSSLTAAAIAHV